MKPRHLSDLENALNRAHWTVWDRFEGEDHRDPAWWLLARPNGSSSVVLVFFCNPELNHQTIMDSHGARTRTQPAAEIHFAQGTSWPSEITKFMSQLETAAKERER